jgi:hypothetical protein
MPYQGFHELFPDIAQRETRTIRLLDPRAYPGVPPGAYCLFETYCNEANCDCRRVMWHVAYEQLSSPIAVITYGWGSASFYRRWFGRPDPDVVAEMQGPRLNLASPQSQYADGVLHMIKQTILRDSNYMRRVKQHYQLFRARIDGDVSRED